jgi:hypothetical protein
MEILPSNISSSCFWVTSAYGRIEDYVLAIASVVASQSGDAESQRNGEVVDAECLRSLFFEAVHSQSVRLDRHERQLEPEE